MVLVEAERIASISFQMQLLPIEKDYACFSSVDSNTEMGQMQELLDHLKVIFSSVAEYL